jgi:hypothetical protein
MCASPRRAVPPTVVNEPPTYQPPAPSSTTLLTPPSSGTLMLENAAVGNPVTVSSTTKGWISFPLSETALPGAPTA